MHILPVLNQHNMQNISPLVISFNVLSSMFKMSECLSVVAPYLKEPLFLLVKSIFVSSQVGESNCSSDVVQEIKRQIFKFPESC